MSAVPVPATRCVARCEVTVLDGRHNMVVPADAHTLDGFRRWALQPDFPRAVRVTFDRGAIRLDMSNEEIQKHNKVKGEITRVLGTLNRDLDLGELYSDGVLVTHVGAEVSNNPDAMFIRWETLDEGRAVLTAREGTTDEFIEVIGTPDWVLEVVSLSSVAKDTKLLRDAYHRAGIPEYWLIDARGDAISFQILRRNSKKYTTMRPHQGWSRSSVFGRSFRLDRVAARRGLPRYTLHVQ